MQFQIDNKKSLKTHNYFLKDSDNSNENVWHKACWSKLSYKYWQNIYANGLRHICDIVDQFITSTGSKKESTSFIIDQSLMFDKPNASI